MKSILKYAAFLFLSGIILVISCKKEISCENCSDGNKPPIANAGLDAIIILPIDSVMLDGSSSYDPDGRIVSWRWTKISGPVLSIIIKADSSKTLTKTLVMGVYKFELKVTDNGGLSAKDTVQIIVNDPGVNQPPVANAGANQTITLPIDSALLNGNLSFDPDGTIVSYQWTKISGPSSYNIANTNAIQTPVTNLVQGIYEFELKVTDDKGASAKDTVQILIDNPAVNQPPIACAGADQVITLPINSVNLNGSCSTDPENNITGYAWAKISGPSTYNITNANAVQTQVTNLVQGIYKFELKVTDAGGLFSKDTMQVTVNAAIVYTCSDTNRQHINAQLMPIGTLSDTRSGMTVASAGNKILFAGGCCNSSRVDIYNITTNTWSTAELCVGRYSISTAANGNKIFFGGGEVGDGTWPVDSVDIYDVSANTWTVSHLSTAGNAIAGAAVGDKVLFAGGDGGFSGPGRETRVDIFNLTTNSWSTQLLSEIKRGEHAAVTANNKIYIAGGETWPANWSNWSASNKIDIYDNSTNTWSTSTMQEGKFSLTGIYANGKLYWAGGQTGSYPSLNPSCLVEIQDVNTGSSSIQQLSAPAEWGIDEGQNAVVKNGKLVFLGNRQTATNKFDIYDPTTNTWSIGVLPVNIHGASIISVNNTVYVAGGKVNGVLSNLVYKLEF